MRNIGIVEGFFGPAWSDEHRKSYAEFLSKYGGEFYIYAPKQDPHLRKSWRDKWDLEFLTKIRNQTNNYHFF